jgi:hypothetical protein
MRSNLSDNEATLRAPPARCGQTREPLAGTRPSPRVLLLWTPGPPSPHLTKPPTGETIARTFEDRAANDDRINQTFARTNLDRLTKEFVDQPCGTTGGPCTYTGRDMVVAHTKRDPCCRPRFHRGRLCDLRQRGRAS